MAQTTEIEWTDATSNPLRYRDKATNPRDKATRKDVWACVKVSAGCAHCYAEALALRFERGGPFTKSRLEGVEPYVSDEELGKLLRSRKLAGKRVFLCDMTDCFGEWVPDDLLDTLFAVMALRPDVTFQVLTKRAHWMRTYMTAKGLPDRWAAAVLKLADDYEINALKRNGDLPSPAAIAEGIRGGWRVQLPHVWLGVSVENPEARNRLPDLMRTPAAVRFVSAEPLLAELDLTPWLESDYDRYCRDDRFGIPADASRAKLNWVIVGGESGHGARPCDVVWVRDIVRQCQAADVPVFVKQLGAEPVDTRTKNGFPFGWPDRTRFEHRRFRTARDAIALKDRKGGDMAEWPEDLRVRQFPEARS